MGSPHKLAEPLQPLNVSATSLPQPNTVQGPLVSPPSFAHLLRHPAFYRKHILSVKQFTHKDVHALFALEHNAVCDHLKKHNTKWDDERLFQQARLVVSALLANKYLKRNPSESERPLLNERAIQLVGQSFDLLDPIVNGRGSIKTGDTVWRVEGPELPRGTRITVVGADGTLLKVVPA